jgi:hypothetical protein
MTNFSEYANKNMWDVGLNLMLSCRHLKIERLKMVLVGGLSITPTHRLILYHSFISVVL